MSRTKKVVRLLGIVGVTLATLYALLLGYSPSSGTTYRLDLAELRRVARSLPGPGPTEIRVERPFDIYFRKAMIEAGESWDLAPMAVASYQLVYPDRTIVVDAAMDRASAAKGFPSTAFDDASFARIGAALDRASAIVVTHEHMDHLGGIATHPRLAALRPALRLTAPQVAHPELMAPVEFPSGAMDGYVPLRYDRITALAPGVVLIAAAGHTPGSQMVYVSLENGRELLLLGDVSWYERNVTTVRERPLLIALVIGEDRGVVLGQLASLHALRRNHPEVRLVPGHDGRVLDELVRDGTLVRGFR